MFAGLIPVLASCDSNKPAIPAAKTGAAEVCAPETALMATADFPVGRTMTSCSSISGKMEAVIEGFRKPSRLIRSRPKPSTTWVLLDKMGKHDRRRSLCQAAAFPTNPA
jgi:hypothetical protein